jgi:hypothetical protein
MPTSDPRRYRVLLTDSYGDLVDGHWETEKRLGELPDAGEILYLRDGAGGRRIRARVHEIDSSSPLAIVATVEPVD